MPKNIDEKENFPDEFYSDPMGLKRYVVQEKNLFQWLAPSKVEKNWQKSEMRFFLASMVLIAILLLLFSEFLLTLVLVLGMLVILLIATTKPIQLSVSVTTIGIKVSERYYYWEQITQFWFEEKNGIVFLYLRDLLPQVHVFRLIFRAEDKDSLQKIIGTYLLFKKPQETQIQKKVREVLNALPIDIDPWLL